MNRLEERFHINFTQEVQPFKYANGNAGLIANVGKRVINLTLNFLDNPDKYSRGYVLKMWGEAKDINEILIDKLGTLRGEKMLVGIMPAYYVEFKKTKF